jgi:hypothetical protein
MMMRSGGQSMTEFAVGLASLALMLLGTITIAGYQEVQRRSSVAARQAAFQVAWMGARTAQKDVIAQAAEPQLTDNSLTDAVGRNRYVRASDIHPSASQLPTPGTARLAANAMVVPLRAVSGFLGGNFDLSTDGFVGIAIDVKIAANPSLPAPFDTIEVQSRQPFALMTDAWNASGPRHVSSRTSGLVPTSALTNLRTLWQPLLVPLALIEPSLTRLCLGIIEADRVPEDRLGAGRTPLPGRCP